MRYVIPMVKVLLVLAGGAACAWMTRRFGPWMALAIWAASMGVLCLGIAAAIRWQAPEKVTLVNYLMGLVLQWGYGVARGRLPGIVAVSWGIWLLIGAAGIIGTAALSSSGGTSAAATQPQPRGTLVMAMLVLAWIIDGAALLRLVAFLATGGRSSGASRSLLPIAAILVVMIGGSVALVTLSHSAWAARAALLLAGGPPLVLAVAYGAFILVILTAGRKTRWN